MSSSMQYAGQATNNGVALAWGQGSSSGGNAVGVPGGGATYMLYVPGQDTVSLTPLPYNPATGSPTIQLFGSGATHALYVPGQTSGSWELTPYNPATDSGTFQLASSTSPSWGTSALASLVGSGATHALYVPGQTSESWELLPYNPATESGTTQLLAAGMNQQPAGKQDSPFGSGKGPHQIDKEHPHHGKFKAAMEKIIKGIIDAGKGIRSLTVDTIQGMEKALKTLAKIPGKLVNKFAKAIHDSFNKIKEELKKKLIIEINFKDLRFIGHDVQKEGEIEIHYLTFVIPGTDLVLEFSFAVSAAGEITGSAWGPHNVPGLHVDEEQGMLKVKITREKQERR